MLLFASKQLHLHFFIQLSKITFVHFAVVELLAGEDLEADKADRQAG